MEVNRPIDMAWRTGLSITLREFHRADLVACESNRPYSLLARVAFCTRAGSEEGRLFSQATDLQQLFFFYFFGVKCLLM